MLSRFIGLRYSFSRQQSHLVAFISRISTLGMVLAVSLLILVTSVMNGFDQALKEKIINIVPHVTLVSDEPLSNWQTLVESAKTHPEVEAASPFSFFQGMLVQGDKIKPLFLTSFDPDEQPENSLLLQKLKVMGFEGFTHANEIILGEAVASHLGVNPGESIQFMGANQSISAPVPIEMKVVGIIRTGTQMDHKLGLTDRQTLAKLQGFQDLQAVNGIRLYLKDIFKSQEVAIDQRFALGLPYASDWTSSLGNLYQAVQMSRKLIVLLVFIIIAVAAFNLVSTLILAVNDKASDVAILRTLGCTRRQILGIFIFQGAAIGVMGVLFGIVFGVLLSFGLPKLVNWGEQILGSQLLKTEIYPIDYLPTDIRIEDIAVISLMALGLCLVATIIPAVRAAKLSPARILRYE